MFQNFSWKFILIEIEIYGKTESPDFISLFEFLAKFELFV